MTSLHKLRPLVRHLHANAQPKTGHHVEKPFKVVIMGPPGSGKGTVSERILRHFNMVHISSGDQLRKHLRLKTALGIRASDYMSQGKLVPDSLVSQIMALEVINNANNSWLLDGFPRTVAQAQLLYTLDPLDAVIELDVPFDVIIDRLKCRWIHAASGRIYNLEFNPPKTPGLDDVTSEPLTQREDDKPETVMARLQNYETWERPVSEYFGKLNLVHRFTGSTTNEIWPMVREMLATHMKDKMSQS